MKLFLISNCLILLFCFQACTPASSKEKIENTPSLTKGASAEIGTVVQTARAERKLFNYFIFANGKIQSLAEQKISADVNGRLAVCNAKPGQQFSEGALIARLVTTSIELKIERSQLNLYNAQKEYESQLLGYQGLLSGQDSASIRKKLHISSGLAGAEQDLKEANLELSESFIKAPFFCKVADVSVQAGDPVKAGQELFRLYDPGSLILVVKILETDISLLKIGMAAEITAVASPDKKFKAVVYDVNPYIDENGMVDVRLRVQSHGEALFPGMNATVVINVPGMKSIVVPKEAMVVRNGKNVVFVVEGGLAKWRYVTVGRDNGKELEIKEGVNADEQVITSNNLQLAHDAPIKADH